MTSLINFMKEMIKPHKKELIFITTIATIAAMLSALIPFIYGKLFDLAVKDTAINILLSLIFIWLITSVVSNIIQNRASYLGSKLGTKVTWERESKTYAHFITLPVSFHKNKKTGEILNKISRASWSIENLISNFSGLFPQLLVLIFSLVVVFITQWQLSIILLGIILGYVLVTKKYSAKIVESDEKMISTINKQYGKVYDRLQNVFLIKNFGREAKEKEVIHNMLVTKVMPSMKNAHKRWSNLALYQGLVYNTSFVVLLVFAIFFLRKGNITSGEFIMFFGYINLVFTPLWTLTEFYKSYKRSSVAIRKIAQFENSIPEEMKHGNKILENFQGGIKLDNLSFEYSKDKPVIKNINLDIKPGESIALVGRSGEGKTTISELIMGYYKPTNGQVLFDNINISKLKLQWLREQIATVPQDLSILNDLLINNLKYANPKATKSEIIDAAKAAGAHQFIMKLPKGYETLVGERGIKLSMGQKQRIALTMAFIRNPKILILDEPTSALDAESERIVQEGVKKLIKGRTTIIIAHRFSTVKHADKIIVLEKGKIAEIGNHTELIKKKGIYYNLYNLQMGLN